MKTDAPENVGVINPYALAEVLLTKKINWDRISDPTHVLENAFGKPYEQLFDPANNSPLYAGLQYDTMKDNLIKSDQEININVRFEDSFGNTLPTDTRVKEKATDADVDINDPLSNLNIKANVNAQTEWKDPGDFFEEGAEMTDPIQGALGDCYFIAAMASVAWARTYVIAHRARSSDNQNNFVDAIEFFDNGRKDIIEVTEQVPLHVPGDSYIYARSFDHGEIWPAIYEKAYAKWKTNSNTDRPDYARIAGGDPVRALAELTGLTRYYYWTTDHTDENIWSMIRQNSLSRQTFNPMVAWTYPSGDKSPDRIKYENANLVANHAYSIIGWHYHNRQKYIVLRNPWGRTEGTLNIFDGTWYAYDTPYYGGPGFWRRFVMRNTDGIFAMRADTFKKYFAGFGLVK